MYKHINFHDTNDADLLTHLETKENVTAYIKKLIKDDIDREKHFHSIQQTKLEEDTKRRFENYTQTKAFKSRIKEVIESDEIQKEIDKYIQKEIKKQLSVIQNLLKG